MPNCPRNQRRYEQSSRPGPWGVPDFRAVNGSEKYVDEREDAKEDVIVHHMQ